MLKRPDLIILAWAVLLLAGCAKTETTTTTDPDNPDPRQITLVPSTGKVSRAGNLTIDDIANDGGTARQLDVISVKGEGADGAKMTMFFGDIYRYDFDHNGIWTWGYRGYPEKSHIWPGNGPDYPIHFFSTFPTGSMSDIPGCNSAVELRTGTYGFAFTTATEAKNQVDWMVAHTKVIASPISGQVMLSFAHQLSKINFKIQVSEKATMVVQSIALKTIASKNEFNLFQPISDTEVTFVSPFGWTPLTAIDADKNAPQTFPYCSLGVAPDGQPVQQFVGVLEDGAPKMHPVLCNSGSLMLLPQQYPAAVLNSLTPAMTAAEREVVLSAGAYIEVVYRMFLTETGKDIVGWTSGATKPDASTATEQFVRVGFPLDLTKNTGTPWEPGRSYTYVLNFGGAGATNGILIDPDFVKPDGSTDTGKGVDNPAEVYPGDKLFESDGSIQFKVNVGDWS